MLPSGYRRRGISCTGTSPLYLSLFPDLLGARREDDVGLSQALPRTAECVDDVKPLNMPAACCPVPRWPVA